MNNFVLGQYVPSNSYLHKMDPRSKIISTIILMIAVFFLKNYYEMLAALLVVFLILVSAKLSLFKALKGMKPLLMISLFVFIFQIFFNKEGDVIFNKTLNFSLLTILVSIAILALFFVIKRYVNLSFILLIFSLILIFITFAYLDVNTFKYYELKIYKEGLDTSIFVFVRLITIVFIATILTLTTKPTDLTLGIERLLKPLKVFKINPEEIALIISIALRYIPTILDEAYKIMDAQAARGADFKNGSIVKRVRILVSLLVPMFVISFERSDELADAMLARNFVPGMPKTRYHNLKWKFIDTIGIIFSCLFLGGSICLMIM